MANERFVYIILAIFIPPLPVFLKYGCKEKFWLCLLLTLFFFLPGMIYAIYVLTK
ncbi:hypothetical protein HPP92_010027 [Vanilla planifolia]|uniref:Uncharacterized protein n=1 Tax=Vanilla planifolia TaxID=51239 RepID=A0A835V604_VANPL|nr:hypothetical protein HPP92_015298 [Vanilla planifolia]KAG0485948.1 hypothetical protein HPP92_010027 [Vanilla planifolia]